jgi:hypothetical protein
MVEILFLFYFLKIVVYLTIVLAHELQLGLAATSSVPKYLRYVFFILTLTTRLIQNIFKNIKKLIYT